MRSTSTDVSVQVCMRVYTAKIMSVTTQTSVKMVAPVLRTDLAMQHAAALQVLLGHTVM